MYSEYLAALFVTLGFLSAVVEPCPVTLESPSGWPPVPGVLFVVPESPVVVLGLLSSVCLVVLGYPFVALGTGVQYAHKEVLSEVPIVTR